MSMMNVDTVDEIILPGFDEAFGRKCLFQ